MERSETFWRSDWRWLNERASTLSRFTAATQVVLPKNTPPPCWLSEHFHHNEKWKMFWFFQVINSLKYLRSRHISHSSQNLSCLYFLTLFIFSSLSSLCFRGNSICLTAKQFRIFVTSVNISQRCVYDFSNSGAIIDFFSIHTEEVDSLNIIGDFLTT